MYELNFIALAFRDEFVEGDQSSNLFADTSYFFCALWF